MVCPLSIGYVTAHNGEFHVESMPEKGTVITIVLPIYKQDAVVIEPGHRGNFPEILNVDVAVMNQGNGRFLGEVSDSGDHPV